MRLYAVPILALLLLGGCTIPIGQASILPPLKEPVAEAVEPLAGYRREERLLALPGLGDVHVARLTRAGNRSTIIYSGGNGSFISTSGKRLNTLAAVTGADVVTFDYPGRGGTTVPNTTDALIALGPELMTALRQVGWVRDGAVYSHGFSLGGATASNIARSGGFSGLVLESTAADIPAVARNMVPAIMKPFIRLKVSDDLKRFDYASYALSARTPILVIAGEEDAVVDAETSRRFAEALKRAGATVEFIQVPGGHGDALSTEEAKNAIRQLLSGTAR